MVTNPITNQQDYLIINALSLSGSRVVIEDCEISEEEYNNKINEFR